MSDNLTPLIDILKSNPQDYQLVFSLRNGVEFLLAEIKYKGLKVLWNFERFYLVSLTSEPLLWIQWSCHEFELVNGDSIKQLTLNLKKYPLWYSNFSFNFHRRQALVLENLKRQATAERLNFPEDHVKFHQERMAGFWTLLEPNLLLIAKKATSWRYLGEMEFNENKEDPPSRAYLKLWEILMRIPQWPQLDDVVLDLGSSPGGWSWVLANFSKNVVSIDKAKLAPTIAKHPHVKFIQESIFAIDPKQWLHAHWIFCDVICYPDKILELILNWLKLGYKGNLIFTIKFQGETDFKVIQDLQVIPHSKLIHLYHNKHELTWCLLQRFS